jgi:hypothetical protein
MLLLSVAAMISFTQCNTPTPESLCSNTTTRGKVISSLVSNTAYMNEVMDSMRVKHPAAVLATSYSIAKSDKTVQVDMMNNMMNMCKSDSSMCKMMMGKTMDMCDADQSKCNMMMGSMKSHPKIMKSMEGMGDMKEMKGMKMIKK